MASFNWIQSIRDPTLAGWLTAVLYLVCSLSCWKSGREAEVGDGRGSNEHFAWRSISILFLALGINKQLNLLTALTTFGRAVAHLQGWYERRQPLQIVVIGVLAVSCMLVVVVLLIWMRRAPIPTWLALIGTMLIVTFVLIRAVSYHGVDRFLFERIMSLRWNSVIEIGGIGLVLVASQWRQVSRLKSASPPRVHQ
jgi:hypothetical protein